MLVVGARGANHVRGKDSVHLDFVSDSENELFSRPVERTKGNRSRRKELI